MVGPQRRYSGKPLDQNSQIYIIKMTIQEAIEARHSVRAYKDQPLADEVARRLEEEIAVVNQKGNLHVQLRVGYYGEHLVLLAQTLGLNTCWVGLSYSKVPGTYVLEEGEKIACYIAIGYGETQGVGHKIKSVEKVSNASDATPSWFRKGVEAALLAPTAVNQQIFSFEYVGVKDGRHQVCAKKGFSMIGYTRMDLGIAKYHFEIGAGKEIPHIKMTWRK